MWSRLFFIPQRSLPLRARHSAVRESRGIGNFSVLHRGLLKGCCNPVAEGDRREHLGSGASSHDPSLQVGGEADLHGQLGGAILVLM